MEQYRNRVDIDIDPENMDEDLKEVFKLLKDEEDYGDEEIENEINLENENDYNNNNNQVKNLGKEKFIESRINGGIDEDFILLLN